MNDAAEKFRQFMAKRPYLHGEDRLITEADYESLKARDGRFWSGLSTDRAAYLHGFIDGWQSRR